MSKHSIEGVCPCGSGYPLAACCAPFLAGIAHCPTAESLMRSRYTAYALARGSYLEETWHPSTRPASIELNGNETWIGLRILATQAGGVGDPEGSVEFVARYKIGGRAYRMHEVSRFVTEDGRWYYLGGRIEGD